VARLGVARVVDARRYRARRVSAALEALLAESGYRTAAERASKVIASEDGPGAACEAIEAALGCD
jgi:UDP:flavonoid glycosyltransferase YjiC (YdhE family)